MSTPHRHVPVGPTPARKTGPRAAVVALVCLTLLASCGPRRLAVLGPVEDPARLADDLRERTRLDEPLQVVFDWRANDQGVRASGRGVTRAEPEYRARLDLFLGNGETALRAALVEGELRVPPGAPRDLLPPPDLMWAALGVFRPGSDARLLGGDRLEGGAIRLRYGYPDGTELHYQVAAGRLSRVDLMEGGQVVQEVGLTLGETGRFPEAALYRNRAEFRELRLDRESLETVDPFPDEIWTPTGR